jgi:hypothetical protein
MNLRDPASFAGRPRRIAERLSRGEVNLTLLKQQSMVSN